MVLAGLHMLAAVAVLVSAAGFPVRGLLLAAILASLAYYLDRFGNRSSPRFVRCLSFTEQTWRLIMGDGRVVELPLHRWFIHPWLLILVFRQGRWRQRTVILLAGMGDASALRRLRSDLRRHHEDDE